MLKKIILEDLASMVKGGFDEVGKRLDNLKQGQKNLKQGHEEIKMKLDNTCPVKF